MSEQILSCADMCPSTFQPLFHALFICYGMGYVCTSQVASQVAALDIGYKPVLPQLDNIKLLYLLGAVRLLIKQ